MTVRQLNFRDAANLARDLRAQLTGAGRDLGVLRGALADPALADEIAPKEQTVAEQARLVDEKALEGGREVRMNFVARFADNPVVKYGAILFTTLAAGREVLHIAADALAVREGVVSGAAKAAETAHAGAQAVQACTPAMIAQAMNGVSVDCMMRAHDVAVLLQHVVPPHAFYSVRTPVSVEGARDVDVASFKKDLAGIVARVNPRADIAFVDQILASGPALVDSGGNRTGEVMEVPASFTRAANLVRVALDVDRWGPEKLREATYHELFHSIEPLLETRLGDRNILREAFPGDAVIAGWMERFPQEAHKLMTYLSATGAVPQGDDDRLALVSSKYSEFRSRARPRVDARAEPYFQSIRATLMAVRRLPEGDRLASSSGGVGLSGAEKAAYAFGEWAAERDRMNAPVAGVFGRIARRLKRLGAEVRDAATRAFGKKLGESAVENLFERIHSGAFAAGERLRRSPAQAPQAGLPASLAPAGWRAAHLAVMTAPPRTQGEPGHPGVDAWIDPDRRFAIHPAAGGVGWDLTHVGTGLRLNPAGASFRSVDKGLDYVKRIEGGADWRSLRLSKLLADPALAARLTDVLNAPIVKGFRKRELVEAPKQPAGASAPAGVSEQELVKSGAVLLLKDVPGFSDPEKRKPVMALTVEQDPKAGLVIAFAPFRKLPENRDVPKNVAFIAPDDCARAGLYGPGYVDLSTVYETAWNGHRIVHVPGHPTVIGEVGPQKRREVCEALRDAPKIVRLEDRLIPAARAAEAIDSAQPATRKRRAAGRER